MSIKYGDLTIPDELEMLDFFECEPIEYEPQDGLFAYSNNGEAGIVLLFSINAFERTVQAILRHNERDLMVVCHEDARKIEILGDKMHVTFGHHQKIFLELGISPIDISCHSLYNPH